MSAKQSSKAKARTATAKKGKKAAKVAEPERAAATAVEQAGAEQVPQQVEQVSAAETIPSSDVEQATNDQTAPFPEGDQPEPSSVAPQAEQGPVAAPVAVEEAPEVPPAEQAVPATRAEPVPDALPADQATTVPDAGQAAEVTAEQATEAVAGPATEAPTAEAPPVSKPRRAPKRAKPRRDDKSSKLSALDAAARVLGETGQAMTCPELIGAMAAKGYWTSPGGKTPQATLYAAMTREIAQKGTSARFRRASKGKFALAGTE